MSLQWRLLEDGNWGQRYGGGTGRKGGVETEEREAPRATTKAFAIFLSPEIRGRDTPGSRDLFWAEYPIARGVCCTTLSAGRPSVRSTT